MRKFIVHQYKDLDLTIHKAIDKIDINDIIAELKDFYHKGLSLHFRVFRKIKKAQDWTEEEML